MQVSLEGIEVNAPLGTVHHIDYAVTDDGGQTTRKARAVVIVDTAPPLVVLRGPDTVALSVGGDLLDGRANGERTPPAPLSLSPHLPSSLQARL